MFFRTIHYSRVLRRAETLSRNGDLMTAYQEAVSALASLRTDSMLGKLGCNDPGAGTLRVSLAILIEQLAARSKKPGLSIDDLRDSLRYLAQLSSNEHPTIRKLRNEWVPYFQGRLDMLSNEPGDDNESRVAE